MRGDSSDALEPGQVVEILGGVFAGRRGVVEGITASGKVRVRVETLRTFARARVAPDRLRPVTGGSEAG